MVPSLAPETVPLLIQDFYKDILGRAPDPGEVSDWAAYVAEQGYVAAAIQSVLESFLNSEEYKKLQMQRISLLNPPSPASGVKLRVAVWGTGDESRLVFLILMYRLEWIGVEIDCFIGGSDIGSLYGLPVKKPGELDASVDKIVIANTSAAFDDIFGRTGFTATDPRLCTFDVKRLFFILPDPATGRLDSMIWAPLLNRSVVIYSGGATGERFVRLINGLNGVFATAFEKTMRIDRVIEDGEPDILTYNGQEVFIARDKYVDTFAGLLAFGVPADKIRIVHYTSPDAKLEDEFMKDGEPFVYTMTKVGTISIHKSLNHCNIRNRLTHFITPEPLKMLNMTHDYCYPSEGLCNALDTFWSWFTDTIYINDYLSKNLNQKKLYVATGVRNPLEQMLSFFFQRYSAECRLGFRSAANKPDDIYSEVTACVRRCREQGDWFANELKPNLHIDVYQHPFDHSKGYQIIEENNVRLLIFRLENLDEIWEEAAVEWLGAARLSGADLALQRANEADGKQISDLYKEVKSSIKFDPALIEGIYSTQYAKHFYSDEELRAFKQKWLNR